MIQSKRIEITSNGHLTVLFQHFKIGPTVFMEYKRRMKYYLLELHSAIRFIDVGIESEIGF